MIAQKKWVRLVAISSLLFHSVAFASDPPKNGSKKDGLDGKSEEQAIDAVNHRPGFRFNQYVRSIHDFKIHIAAHRARVLKTSMNIFKKFPRLIERLPENSKFLERILNEVGLETKAELEQLLLELTQQKGKVFSHFRIHDREKIMRVSQLKDFGYTGTHAFYVRLANIYKRGDRSEGVTKALVKDLNGIGAKISEKLLRSYGWWEKPHARLILLIEGIADSLDRANDPVAAEEYNNKTQKSTREWFNRDPLRSKLCEIFHDTWKASTVGMGFIAYFMNHLLKNKDRITFFTPGFELPSDPVSLEMMFHCGRTELHKAKVASGFRR